MSKLHPSACRGTSRPSSQPGLHIESLNALDAPAYGLTADTDGECRPLAWVNGASQLVRFPHVSFPLFRTRFDHASKVCSALRHGRRHIPIRRESCYPSDSREFPADAVSQGCETQAKKYRRMTSRQEDFVREHRTRYGLLNGGTGLHTNRAVLGEIRGPPFFVQRVTTLITPGGGVE